MNVEATILIVDDDPTNLRVLQGALAETPYKLLMATSGERALYQAAHYPPDLILLDVLMPGMDGFETCRQFKLDPRLAHIPVIFLTALDDAENKVTGFGVGGVDYITKPFDRAEVLARVNTHLILRRLQQQLEAQNALLQAKNEQLEAALAQVKQLSGLLPICSHCKKIRDDGGYWHRVETYIEEHSEAQFTHGLCPDCLVTLYPDYYPQK